MSLILTRVPSAKDPWEVHNGKVCNVKTGALKEASDFKQKVFRYMFLRIFKT